MSTAPRRAGEVGGEVGVGDVGFGEFSAWGMLDIGRSRLNCDWEGNSR